MTTAMHRGWAAILLLALAPNARCDIAFGTRTQIWPFLFAEESGRERGYTADEAMKLEVALGNLDRYKALGASWNIVDVWQEVDGPDEFRRLDRAVLEHDQRGIQVALRLLEVPEIYDRLREGGRTRAQALAEYRQWTERLARRYGRGVRYYMISNETDHDIGYNRPIYRPFRRITLDEYREILSAGFESIHAVDPALTVTDHGVSSYSMALAVMADLALSGQPGEALAFWRSMDYAEPDEPERSYARLARMLAGAEARRRVEFARRSTAELAPFRDVFQLHHYWGAATVTATLDWIRRQMGASRTRQPILAGEVGYEIPAKRGTSWDGRPINVADMTRYSEINHGTSLARTIAALAGNGIEDILYWQMRFHVAHSPAASLYPPTTGRNDFRTTYPVEVFKFLVREISGARPVPGMHGLSDPDVVEYRFRRDGEYSLIWAAGGDPVTLPPVVGAQISAITDVSGKAVEISSWTGQVGTSPIMVYWRTGAPER